MSQTVSAMSVSEPETIAQRYRRIGGFTSGFDYLRLALAVAVIVQHSFLTSYGRNAGVEMWGSWTRIFLAPILLMFFALSGFLIAGSLKKNPTVASFFTMRAVRLVPALAVEVLLSALILGPLVTQFSLERYFSDWYFYRYFTNIVGRIHMELPGVFLHNPLPIFVNLSLWTVPYELECYLAIAVLWLTGALKRRWLLVAITFVLATAGTIAAFMQFDSYWATNRPLPRSLVVAFLAGILLNLFADKVRLTPRIAFFCLIGLVVSTLLYQSVYIAAFFAAYLAVFLGMTNPSKKNILLSGDYSYGLYLFAFPIQQTYALLFPSARHWFLNAAVTIVVGLAYAAFSWWVVERPILRRKQKIASIAERGVKAAGRLFSLR